MICSLFLEEADDRQRETENVRTFSEVVRQKEALGMPLIGEAYVVEHKEKTPEEVHLKVKRLFLHAHQLRFSLPTGEEQLVNCPLPQDLSQLLEKLT